MHKLKSALVFYALFPISISICTGVSAQKKGEKNMDLDGISQDVREYLATNDSLYRACVRQKYPDIENKMKRAQTRNEIMTWLAGESPWKQEYASFAANCLEFLRAEASESESGALKPFLLHYDPLVRLRAYDYFVVTYFLDKNTQALLRLLESMLIDDDNRVRVAGIRYMERIGAEKEYLGFFKAWQIRAAMKGWLESESAELIMEILKKYDR